MRWVDDSGIMTENQLFEVHAFLVEVNENENEGLNWSQSGCLDTLLDVIYCCLCLRFIWPESLVLLTVIKVELNLFPG
jgi:hypothetical protein